jgi:hypothetical protein
MDNNYVAKCSGSRRGCCIIVEHNSDSDPNGGFLIVYQLLDGRPSNVVIIPKGDSETARMVSEAFG